MATTGPRTHAPLARRVREQFVADLDAGMQPLAEAIHARLVELGDIVAAARERQERRDARTDFERYGADWLSRTRQALQRGLLPGIPAHPARGMTRNLELIGDEVVEQKILASRLSMAIGEKAAFELNDLKVRMQHLEGGAELSADDIFQPDAAARIFVEQWQAAGLSRTGWVTVAEVINQQLVPRFVGAYKRSNQMLIDKGILPDIDLSTRVKRGTSAPGRRADGTTGPESQPGTLGGNSSRGFAAGGQGGSGGNDGGGGGGGGGGGSSSASGVGGGAAGAGHPGAGARGGSGHHGGSGGGSAYGGGVADETRLMTSSTPLARARMRATGVIGQLKRMLTERVAGFDPERAASPSPALEQAITQHAAQVQTRHASTQQGVSTLQEEVVYDDAAVERAAGDLRQRTGELKRKASTSGEKATIEIVALMFQSILAEERIPAAVRVWFARLQMPVLRVALAEPEFFGTLQHPARQLIDRMGSCVMGFDASSIGGSALEVEIRRVVQVIEQYPETGRRVFQLVYDEFQKFLSRFLTEGSSTQRLVGVAQQVEQKETMAVQYTIELRSMLDSMPVRDEIREFLFKVWAEVLALAAVKNGPQHEDTLALKKSAADLVWAASAKPNRNDRTRVINDLPKLLLRLRQGMSLLGVEGTEQEGHIKVIGDTLADAFLSKTEAIPQAQIDAMSRRLEKLEDFVSDESDADIALDPDSIEMLLGIDASMIEVVADGGSKPNDAMQAWARELQLGTWFSLDHNGKTHQVQYAWCSDRKQLHLFASSEGRSFLVQAKRLASYLQAGLLLPTEEEALTIRATRDALSKLDANPERLLA